MLYETAGSRRTAIVHDITINDHISYIELVHVTVYSQIWRHFLWILTLIKSLEDLSLL